MSSPKVSLITPAYNAAPYIRPCIESVQAQTLRDWEMLIVDDASTDGTAELVRAYLSDPRIRFFQNDRNRGPGHTRNRALDAATGEWLAVLDADDWMAPERLERLLAFAGEMGADMVADLPVHVDPKGRAYKVAWSTYGRNPKRPRFFSVEEVLKTHPAFKPLMRTDFVRSRGIRYVEEILRSQDYAFHVEILLKGARFAVLPEPLYFYRIYPGTITGRFARDPGQIWKSCEHLSRLPETTPLQRKLLWRTFRREKTNILYRSFADALRRRDWKAARDIVREEPRVLRKWLTRVPGAIYRRLFAPEQRYNPRRKS